MKHTQHQQHTEHQHHAGHGFRHRQDEGRHRAEGHHGSEESERHRGRGGHGGQRGGGPGRGHVGEPGFGGPSFDGGGRGGRARRGEARYILLEALRGGPKHGYEIIKSLEERSGGRYAPSPGTVYPTMQYLEDLGLVRADKDAERRVFHLTEAGVADLDSHAQEIADFWERFAASSPTSGPEAGFVREELHSLERTVWEGLHSPLGSCNTETARAVRAALEKCRNEIREIVTAQQA